MNNEFEISHNEQYGFNEPDAEFDFEGREKEMDLQFDQGLKYRSRTTINLRKQNPR